ncbi:MAG TPA: hypothetical protein VH120_08200 [Gemmataceae bacterium]|jgi:hypothetical protein|nr:hypothetical protein [Gemmataceae bacterium]
MARRNALIISIAAVVLSIATLAPAQSRSKGTPKSTGAATVAAAHGTVVKADSSSVTVRPRGAEGRFEKELVLQVTGTTKVTQLTIQNRGGKPVAVQQDSDAKSLQPQQEIAVIYAAVGDGMVLLSAVVTAAK